MTGLQGTWYDGRSSRGLPARLESPAPGRLRLVAGEEVREFDAGSVHLSPRLGRLARQLRFEDGAHLEVEDSPLLDEWLPARSRLEAGVDWLERRRAAVLSATVALVVGVWAFFQLGLPWMAREVAPLVPAPIENAISKQGLALLDGRLLEPTRLPAARRESLQIQFRDMTRHLPRGDGLRLDFRHAPGLGPNAFVLPNGQVVMTDQLVTLAGDDEELLAVLAHEAGHHEHRHGLRRALEKSAMLVVVSFLFGDVSGTGALSVSLPVLLVEQGFSRGHEREADGFAFELLAEQGYSPEAFARIMGRMSGGGEIDRGLGPVGYLTSHPPSGERMDAARAAAKKSQAAKENGRAPKDPPATEQASGD